MAVGERTLLSRPSHCALGHLQYWNVRSAVACRFLMVHRHTSESGSPVYKNPLIGSREAYWPKRGTCSPGPRVLCEDFLGGKSDFDFGLFEAKSVVGKWDAS